MLNHTFKLHTANAVFGSAVDAAELYREHAAKCSWNAKELSAMKACLYSTVWELD